MELLLNAGEVVMWAIAVTLGIGVVAIVALYGWDKWTGYRWERNMRAKR